LVVLVVLVVVVEEVEFGDLRGVFYLVEGYEGGHDLWLVLVGGYLGAGGRREEGGGWLARAIWYKFVHQLKLPAVWQRAACGVLLM
jgi:hypothetical protein